MARLYIVLAALLSGYRAFSGPYYFQHYQVENGVANNWIISITQDHMGFMWFGTMEGLNRFDGYSFKTLRPNEKFGDLPKTCFILSLLEDRAQRLWVGSTAGLFIYSFRNETFTLVPGSRNKPVASIYEAKDGTMYFLADNRLCRYDAGGKKLLPVLEDAGFTALTEDSSGNLWLGTAGGKVVCYTPGTGKRQDFDILAGPAERMAGMVHAVIETGQQEFLVGTSGSGLIRFNPKTGIKKVLLSHDNNGTRILDLRKIIRTGENEYWIASESGIFIYRTTDGAFTNLRRSYNDPNHLSDDAIHSLYRDKAGSIWVGTYSGGINYHANSSFEFRKFYVNGRDDGLAGNYINRIHGDKNGNIWIGTGDSGLNRLNPRDGKITRFTGKGSGSSYKNIQALSVNGDQVWVGTYFHGLEVLDLEGKRLPQPPDLAALKNDFIVQLHHLKSGALLAGTEKALLRRDPKKEGFRPVNEVPANLSMYFEILEDSEGTVWVGTKGEGVFYYNTARNTKGQYRFDAQDPKSLGADFINDIFEDSEKNLWISTEGGGLCLLDRRTGTFKRFTTATGFSSNYIQKVLEDARGNLWITSTRGLMRWNRRNGVVEVFTKKHGLLSDQFIGRSGYKAGDGVLYFGSAKGLISFNPNRIVDFPAKNPIYITDFQVDNQSLTVDPGEDIALRESILLTKEVTLPYNRSTFSIGFSALDYGNLQTLTYHYRLEGLQDQWTTIGENRRIYFTAVPPGEYTFKIHYAAAHMLHKGQSVALKIRITPPFWATSWAKAIYVLLALGVLSWSVWYYQRLQLEKIRSRLALLKEKSDKELYEAKVDFLGSVAHELNTPLTLIKGPLEEMMKRATPDQATERNLAMMERNVNHLMKLTGELLDFRKSELNAYWLNFAGVDLNRLVKTTALGFEKEALSKGMAFSVNCPDAPCFVFGDGEALGKIVVNLLGNALKYGEREVSVALFPEMREEKFFRLEIANDGLLIPPESGKKIFEPFVRLRQSSNVKGTGLGLSICKTLAELHKASLYWEARDGKYNVFVFAMQAYRKEPGAGDASG